MRPGRNTDQNRETSTSYEQKRIEAHNPVHSDPDENRARPSSSAAEAIGKINDSLSDKMW